MSGIREARGEVGPSQGHARRRTPWIGGVEHDEIVQHTKCALGSRCLSAAAPHAEQKTWRVCRVAHRGSRRSLVGRSDHAQYAVRARGGRFLYRLLLSPCLSRRITVTRRVRKSSGGICEGIHAFFELSERIVQSAAFGFFQRQGRQQPVV